MMKGLTIHSFTVTAECSLDWDAERWELFTDNPRSQVAARDLNRTFISAAKAGGGREAVRQAVEERMKRYADCGAGDTEPRGHLEDLLDAVFGKD